MRLLVYSNLYKRIALFAGLIVVVFSAIVLYFSATFSSQDFIKQRFSESGLSLLAHQPFSQSGWLNTELTWLNVQVDTEHLYFAAKEIRVQLNLLSIVLGQPQINQLVLTAPAIELKDWQPSIDYFYLPLDLAAQRVEVINGWIVQQDREIQDIELTMIRNGSFGEYGLQTKGHFIEEGTDISFNYSGLLGTDNDNTLYISRSELTAEALINEWQGSLRARLRNLMVDTQKNIDFEFASWSSNWTADKDYLVGPIDFAGGIDLGKGTLSALRFGSIEAAIAYRDENEWAHTVSSQLTNGTLENKQWSGQLGFTVLTDKQRDVASDDWQSFNFVVYGSIADQQPFLSWQQPEMRIAYINGAQQRISHNLDMRRLTIDPLASRWQMLDGVWVELLDDTVTGDFGYAELGGQWPGLTLDVGPSIAADFQPALNLILDDLEFLRALYADVVQ